MPSRLLGRSHLYSVLVNRDSVAPRQVAYGLRLSVCSKLHKIGLELKRGLRRFAFGIVNDLIDELARFNCGFEHKPRLAIPHFDHRFQYTGKDYCGAIIHVVRRGKWDSNRDTDRGDRYSQ